MRKESWNDIIKEEIVDLWSPCAYCPVTRPYKKPNRGTQGSHALVHKRKYNRKKRHKDVNVRLNFLPCCGDCERFSETHKGRQHAWEVLCELHGVEVMVDWYARLNLKIKDIF